MCVIIRRQVRSWLVRAVRRIADTAFPCVVWRCSDVSWGAGFSFVIATGDGGGAACASVPADANSGIANAANECPAKCGVAKLSYQKCYCPCFSTAATALGYAWAAKVCSYS